MDPLQVKDHQIKSIKEVQDRKSRQVKISETQIQDKNCTDEVFGVRSKLFETND